MKQTYIYSLLLIICLSALGYTGYLLAQCAMLLQHNEKYKQLYATISILTSVAVLMTVFMISMRMYMLYNSSSGRDKWLNRSLYISVITLLSIGIYSTTIASQFQCLTSDPLLFQVWDYTKDTSLIGIITSFCILVIMFIYKKDDILKEIGIDVSKTKEKKKDDDIISVKDLEKARKILAGGYTRPYGRDTSTNLYYAPKKSYFD